MQTTLKKTHTSSEGQNSLNDIESEEITLDATEIHSDILNDTDETHDYSKKLRNHYKDFSV